MDSSIYQHALLRSRTFMRQTLLSSGFAGSVSIGFMHATPGDMKSFRSSAERMALMASFGGGGGVASCEFRNGDRRRYL